MNFKKSRLSNSRSERSFQLLFIFTCIYAPLMLPKFCQECVFLPTHLKLLSALEVAFIDASSPAASELLEALCDDLADHETDRYSVFRFMSFP